MERGLPGRSQRNLPRLEYRLSAEWLWELMGKRIRGRWMGEARPLPCWAAEWISAIPDPIIPLWDGFWNGEAYSPSTRRDSSLWQDIFPYGTGLSAGFRMPFW